MEDDEDLFGIVLLLLMFLMLLLLLLLFLLMVVEMTAGTEYEENVDVGDRDKEYCVAVLHSQGVVPEVLKV